MSDREATKPITTEVRPFVRAEGVLLPGTVMVFEQRAGAIITEAVVPKSGEAA